MNSKQFKNSTIKLLDKGLISIKQICGMCGCAKKRPVPSLNSHTFVYKFFPETCNCAQFKSWLPSRWLPEPW